MRVIAVHAMGFPHSDIPGSQVVCHLPETFRRLPRPSSALHCLAIHRMLFRASTIQMLIRDQIKMADFAFGVRKNVIVLQLFCLWSEDQRGCTRSFDRGMPCTYNVLTSSIVKDSVHPSPQLKRHGDETGNDRLRCKIGAHHCPTDDVHYKEKGSRRKIAWRKAKRFPLRGGSMCLAERRERARKKRVMHRISSAPHT